MDIDSIVSNYYDYLFDLINGNEKEYCNYKDLFLLLCNVKFVVKLKRDRTRANVGINLRNRFAEDAGIPYLYVGEILGNMECSVAEMLVGLSIQIDYDVVGNQVSGNRQGDWFWRMLRNLNLYPMYDGILTDSDVIEINAVLNKWMYRKFEPNGKGSIFPLKNPPGDERTVEILYQMQAWIDENFPV